MCCWLFADLVCFPRQNRGGSRVLDGLLVEQYAAHFLRSGSVLTLLTSGAVENQAIDRIHR